MAIGTARAYAKLRASVFALLIVHVILRLIFPTPSVFADLYIYNAIALLSTAVAFFAPTFNDHLARLALSSALFLWAIGSIATGWNDFYTPTIWPNLSDLCYILFYPFILFGLIRALTAHRKFHSLELLDVVIIIFGFSTLIAALFLKSAMAHFIGSSTSVFLSIVYPIGDVVLLSMALIIVIVQRRAIAALPGGHSLIHSYRHLLSL